MGVGKTAGQECAISAPPPIPSHAAGGIAGQVLAIHRGRRKSILGHYRNYK